MRSLCGTGARCSSPLRELSLGQTRLAAILEHELARWCAGALVLEGESAYQAMPTWQDPRCSKVRPVSCRSSLHTRDTCSLR